MALGVAAALVGILAPIYWMAVSALTPEQQLFDVPSLWPSALTLDSFRSLFTERAFWVPLRNSTIVAGATSLLAVVFGAPAAYALARLPIRGRRIVLAMVLAVSMFPQISVVSPLFLLLRGLGLIDTYPGLVVPYLSFSLPLAIWLLVGFFRQMPPELEEAALVDGASRLGTLRHVVLPLAWPGLATTAVVTFLYCWNEFLFALSFTLGPDRYTVPVAIALFRGQYQVPWSEVLAAATVCTIPVALVVLIAQRRIVQGLTAGGVKG